MIVSLRTSTAGDRRAHVRVPVRMQVRLEAPGVTIVAETLDVSEGGMLLLVGPDFPDLPERCPVHVSTERLGRLRAEVLGASRAGLHLIFTDLPADSLRLLRDVVSRTLAADDKFIVAAQTAAAAIARTLQQTVDRGEITEQALFDAHYTPIIGTNPPQMTTPFTALADRLFAPIQEPLLGLDRRVVFAAAVDRNGYLPTHNRAVSQPQRSGDVAWNAANARNRRIFNDRAGLAAARSTRPFLLQTYSRDMGEGVSVLMKEADAPIHVCGRHWGGLRLAYRAESN
jgi:methyl-accepting chemotaxis protein